MRVTKRSVSLDDSVAGGVEQAADEGLERSGCDAAGYRLTGAGVDHFCVVHLCGRWRLLLGFNDAAVAVIIDVGEHRDDDSARDVCTRLYDALDVDPPIEPRDRPPCCDESGPPVDDAQLQEIEDGYRALTRRRRRR